MDASRNYRHWCAMARSLELLGERWSLLVVRDLLLGPRRFTDLMRSLAGITPARLTERLKHLQAAGVVHRDRPPGRREAWYQLTTAGQDLGPIVDALTLWGIRHAPLTVRHGEAVHPEHVLRGTKVWLQARASPARPVTWVWQFPTGQAYTLRFGQAGWVLARTPTPGADVVVDTTPEAWAAFLTAPPGARHLARPGLHLTSSTAGRAEFAAAFNAMPPGERSWPEPSAEQLG